MFVQDSIFKAVTPNQPPIVFVGYEVVGQPTVPNGVTPRSISVDGGDVTINVYF